MVWLLYASYSEYTLFTFKKLEHDFLGRSSEKFAGATKHLKRYSNFSGRNMPNGNSSSTPSKPSLIWASGLRGSFSINKTDLYNWLTRDRDEIYTSWILLTICGPNHEPTALPMYMVNNIRHSKSARMIIGTSHILLIGMHHSDKHFLKNKFDYSNNKFNFA